VSTLDLRNGAHALETPNGDVELVSRTWTKPTHGLADDQKVTVAKEDRCKLAHFLAGGAEPEKATARPLGAELLWVKAGEYEVVMRHDGYLRALRHGEEWRDCVGDNLVLALAEEVQRLRDLLTGRGGAQ